MTNWRRGLQAIVELNDEPKNISTSPARDCKSQESSRPEKNNTYLPSTRFAGFSAAARTLARATAAQGLGHNCGSRRALLRRARLPLKRHFYARPGYTPSARCCLLKSSSCRGALGRIYDPPRLELNYFPCWDSILLLTETVMGANWMEGVRGSFEDVERINAVGLIEFLTDHTRFVLLDKFEFKCWVEDS